MKMLIMILQLVPSIIQAIMAAEVLIPIPGQGKTKLDLILGIITDVYADAASIIPLITKIISRIVGVANSTGAFPTKPAV